VAHGAVPTDVLDGFARLCARLIASADERQVAERVHAEETDPYDTHPALAERLTLLRGQTAIDLVPDERPARCVLLERNQQDGGA
jgi:hypothetical protein